MGTIFGSLKYVLVRRSMRLSRIERLLIMSSDLGWESEQCDFSAISAACGSHSFGDG